MMVSLFNYMSQHFSQITELLLEHIVMTVIAVGIAIVIGVPLGILISYVKKLSGPIVGAANVIQAVPSMALLGLAIPLLGIGTLPAVVMVIIYSLLPIIKNTYMGCCMAFRREVLQWILPIPEEIQMHDQWIGVLNDLKGSGTCIMPEKLLFYRRHEHNNSDFSHNTVPVMIKNRIVFLRALHRQLRRLKN